MSIFTKIKKAIGWEIRTVKPQYDLNPLIYSQLKPFRLPLILIQLIMMIGTLGYVYIEDYSIMHAIFQSAYTFTTTGFGALNEANFSNQGIVFTVTLMIAGFLILTFSVGIVIDVIANGSLLELLKERKMLYKIARLRRHFVICYHNEYTAQLARQFRENHVPFVVVDPSEDIEQIAKENNYPYFVKEEPYKEIAFLKSHLSSAKGAISLSKNISDNITLIASVRLYEKELGRAPFLIISNAETQNEKIRLKKLGADKVVATPSLMAKRVSAMAIRPDMENVLDEFLYKKDTPIDMEEVFVRENSWVVNRELKDLRLRDRLKVSVIGITEGNDKFIQMPKGTTSIIANCRLLLVGSQKGIARAKKIINLTKQPEDI
ncbi:MAG: TrkA family potassium uptake protein [Arcobacter sp.]|jgi:voltage-gated potassium channel|uniref:Potassium channel protein (TrkA domain) n=1 Tax=Arcobacter defluvii TaxID=873191 RepID=A0AAE7E6X2_9BACT|nr:MULTISPECIES: TrkA C-terminal domain-containing protein [Arcobacter]MDY3201151.1 NAD-binding protein [Arcobacter sp.]QKF78365.1 putative potassium channel protein (TrkA domain) [Arcobacter defluvii]RXI30848.1 potassium channel protein [Arcobacter defluvii]BAK74160.1 potassium channel protein [Arcobacter sp. L]